MYLDELRGEVSQGDVFDSLPLACARHPASGLPAVEEARALLLTYDCEYDKPSTRSVMVAAVFPLAAVPVERRGNVRNNRVFSTFYLLPHADFDEAFVDFRHIGQIEKTIVAERAGDGKRLASLSAEAQLALQEQLS